MIYDLEPYLQTVSIMLDFARDMKARHAFALQELSPGGGWGIAYTPHDQPPTVQQIAETLAGAAKAGAAQRGLPRPGWL